MEEALGTLGRHLRLDSRSDNLGSGSDETDEALLHAIISVHFYDSFL